MQEMDVIFKEKCAWSKNSLRNYIIGGSSGNNRIVREAMQNRIIDTFWSTLAMHIPSNKTRVSLRTLWRGGEGGGSNSKVTF